MEIRLKPGESRDEFLYRLWESKGTLTWYDLAIVASDALDEDIKPDAMRKRVRRYRDEHHLIEETDDILRSIQRQKQAFRDERNAWQKQNREQARTEENLAFLTTELRTIGGEIFSDITCPDTDTDQATMLILLTDWHIGAEWKNKWGRYSPAIARQRVRELLRQIYRIQTTRKCERAVVITAGDMINGAIRRTVQLQNRESVVAQIRDATELLANFIHCLCSIFPQVDLTGVAGNHSRLIENKDSAVKDDRLDSVITWATSLMLSHIENFSYIEAQDTTLTSIKIYGREVVGVHGDYDAFSKNGIQNLAGMLGHFPWMICFGHLHSPAFMESSGVLLIRGGALCGTGDDYTIQKRLVGKPSQTIATITPEGLERIQPIFL